MSASTGGRRKSPRRVTAPRRESGVAVVPDAHVPFVNLFVKGSKTEQRKFVAEHARSWLHWRRAEGARGCVVFDIDDTLIDGNEAVYNGFEFMAALYDEISDWFPVHVVTARPDDQHENVMRLLKQRKLRIPPDRLHMLPSHLYDGPLEHVERFKWGVHRKLVEAHGGVVARFGDKLWDVATLPSLTTYLSHVGDRDCCLFWDPALGGTLSGKLPGH